MFSIAEKILAASRILRRITPWARTPVPTPVEQVHSKRTNNLTPEKQQKLEELCKQLFKQKDLITSGKLQLIGLQAIKRRMGKQWSGLAKIVYETTETVMDQYMDKGDIFIRYQDDSYVLIFTRSTPQESQEKTFRIAEEIRERLFALDEEELNDLEIRQAISTIQTDMFMEAGFLDDIPGAMDIVFEDLNQDQYAPDEQQVLAQLSTLDPVEISTEKYRPNKQNAPDATIGIPDIDIAYMPLWDTKKEALTTYLGLAKNPLYPDDLLKGHQALYVGVSTTQRNKTDQAVLKAAGKELALMANEGRKFFVGCPVQHETMYDTYSFEEYKNTLSEIPAEHRKFLILFVMNIDSVNPPKNAYWFAKPLRVLCPYVFAEVPLRRDINCNYLYNSGANAVGVRLEAGKLSEPDIIALLNNLDTKAKSLKIDKTFIFGVSSLSITTSAVCAGFDFLGGSAIHPPVEQPDSVHRYHHADLIKELSGHTQ